MSYTMQGNLIPRFMLVGAGALLVFVTALAGVTRLTGENHIVMPPSRVLESRDLMFVDRADRGVDISDANTGAPIETIPPKTGGFLRGAMRGLLYDVRYGRDHLAQAPDYPFRLTRWADGRLSLEDTRTHRQLELEAFGSTNEQVFARLLDARMPRPIPSNEASAAR
jgi:putative photosynthetic complex assembly protein